MSKYESLNALVKEAEAAGLVVVTLLDLRETLQYKKLGVRVLQEISQNLKAHGLGYFPREVLDNNEQPRQTDEVRVFALNSPVGKVVRAVQEPSRMNDDYLTEISSSGSAGAVQILDQVRALLEG